MASVNNDPVYYYLNHFRFSCEHCSNKFNNYVSTRKEHHYNYQYNNDTKWQHHNNVNRKEYNFNDDDNNHNNDSVGRTALIKINTKS